MQVFEFSFRSKFEKEKEIKSVFFEPKIQKEKKVASVYFLGEKSISNEEISLQEIWSIFRESFYQKEKISFQKTFEESIKKVNLFLKEKSKRSFFPDLSLLFFAIEDKKFALAKLGKIKARLIREGKCFDIFKEKNENFVLKLVFGKSLFEDLILILTDEIFEIFEKTKIFEHLKKMGPFNLKEFKAILESKNKEITKPGVCTLFFFEKEEVKFSKESFKLEEKLKYEVEKGGEFLLKILKNKRVSLVLAFLFFLLLSFILSYFFG